MKGKLKNNPESFFVSDRVHCHPDIVSTLDLSDKALTDTRIPTYEELYPVNWAGVGGKEEMHNNNVLNILTWLRGENDLVSL